MAAEIGQFALILAFLIALYQSSFLTAGGNQPDRALIASARAAALAQGALVATAFGCLLYVHAVSDFSVLNVVENSHSAKPFVYKLSGVWGNHEGSMLLWALILAGYGSVLAATKRGVLMSVLEARALSVQGAVAAAFLAFILFTSNPFKRIFPAPADGMDLNPLLQDPGLAIHPPFLYLGYVGFSITFAYAIAGLLQGRIDADWARAVRPWALAAWVFLTIGIALGSWWAYYELGWGGFWAWDPVENASFMPWLAGTAFLHSLRVVEKRDALKVWTVLLAILAFSLSLIGTFLVRSGVLTSVHAFAVDPARGVFILAILAGVIGGSLTLFAVRGASLQTQSAFEPVSREGAILLNNIFLSTACATVFIGTFYPLFIDVISSDKISVGAPYFNATFPPLMALLFLLLAPGAALAWKKGDLKASFGELWPVAPVAAAGALIALWLNWPKPVAAALGAGLAIWVFGGTLVDLLTRINAFTSPPRNAFSRLGGLPRSYLGMILAHFGIAIVALGVIGAGVWRTEEVQMMQIGDTIKVGAYEARLVNVDQKPGPNYMADQAQFDLVKNGKTARRMTAEHRFYPVRQTQTTEAAIWTRPAGDIYITLGERTSEAGWAVRALHNPLTVWIWFGAGVIALGGVVAASDRRARSRRAAALPKGVIASGAA